MRRTLDTVLLGGEREERREGREGGRGGGEGRRVELRRGGKEKDKRKAQKSKVTHCFM